MTSGYRGSRQSIQEEADETEFKDVVAQSNYWEPRLSLGEVTTARQTNRNHYWEPSHEPTVATVNVTDWGVFGRLLLKSKRDDFETRISWIEPFGFLAAVEFGGSCVAPQKQPAKADKESMVAQKDKELAEIESLKKVMDDRKIKPDVCYQLRMSRFQPPIQ
ncbi:hypothetical protein ACFE04_000567 [Oxalis oulophora]